MKKLIVMLWLVVASVMPVSAQQTQQTPLTLIDSDLFTKASDAVTAGDYNTAVTDFSLLILLNPTYSPGYYGRAQSYYDLNDNDHALEDVNSALTTAGSTVTPEYGAVLYTLRGSINSRQNNLDAALADYSQAITLKPSEQALINRGRLYLTQHDLPAALTDLNSAIALDANNPSLYIYRGEIDVARQDAAASGADYLQFFTMIQPAPTRHAAINSGDTVTLDVDRGVVYVLPFTAKANQYASAIAFAQAGNVDPLMVLIDATGTPLAGDDDSGGNNNALIFNYVIPADGQYSLVVGHSLGGFTGTVLVQFEVTDTPAQQ